MPLLKKTTLIVLTLAALFLFATSSFAAVGPIIGPCTGTRALLPLLPGAPDPCSSPAAYVVYWFYLSLYLAGIAALLILVFAGFMRLASGIVPGAVSSANKMVTGAALGLILLFSGWLLLNTLNPKLLVISNSSFPPLGGYIMGFSPATVAAGEESNFSWALFFEKVDHGILNCYDTKNKQTITNKKIGAFGAKPYESTVEGKHFCRITAQDKDNNTVGLGYADLIVTPACELTWKPGAVKSKKGTLSWKTSGGSTRALLACDGSVEIECSPGNVLTQCDYVNPRSGSSTAEKKRGGSSATCFIKITQPWNVRCQDTFTFP